MTRIKCIRCGAMSLVGGVAKCRICGSFAVKLMPEPQGKISNCCGATPGEVDEETMRCSECGEPCDYIVPCGNEMCDNDAEKGEEFCTCCLKAEAQQIDNDIDDAKEVSHA